MYIGKEDIKKGIRALSLQGKMVCIHSSFKSFGGHVDGGAKAFLEAFLEEGCTVLVFTCSYMYEIYPPQNLRPKRNGISDYSYFENKNYSTPKIFTTDSNDISRESMGIVPYTLLNMPSSKRGYNPINSFAALGKYADELVREQSAEDVWAPLAKLYEHRGYVLLVGVHLDRATIIHYAEQVAGRKPFIRWANNLKGEPSICRVGSCSNGFNNFADRLKPIEKNVMVGKSYWRCFPAKDMVDICAAAMKEIPEISHCEDSNCDRCNDAILGGPIW
ncbi:MAG: AAC(3) family N-acetyltransferase [Clostridia bacterium]